MALVAWVGAALAAPVPEWVGVAVGVGAWWAGRRWLLVVAVGVLASGLAASAWSGLHPIPTGDVHLRGTLAGDPEEVGGAVRAEVVTGDDRLEVWTRGPDGRSLALLLAGDEVEVVGDAEPLPEGTDHLARRHVVGRVQATHLWPVPGSNPLAASTNVLRRLLEQGALGLAADHRAVFAGVVLGDDRGQDAVTVDAFRAAGLSHLLVVSGQNVAFVLVLAAPLASRLERRPRLLLIMTVLGVFLVLTRFEPSVLRATFMAGVAAVADASGRPASGLRRVALAVTAVVLLDPLLIGRLGFQLSVAAATGLVVLGPRITALVPGPGWFGRAVGCTLAAQLATAPLLVAAFGGLPVAALPANVLALPAAGPLMVWGLTGGVAAGIVSPVAGGALSRVLHLPTTALVAWIEAVATLGARLPLGTLGPVPLAVIAVGLAGAGLAGRAGHRWMPVVLVVLTVGAGTATVVPAASGDGYLPLLAGAVLWRPPPGAGPGTVLVIEDDVGAVDLLAALRRERVSDLDLVVMARGGARAAALLAELRRRFPEVPAVSPIDRRLADTTPLGDGDRLLVGAAMVRVMSGGPPLRVSIAPAPP